MQKKYTYIHYIGLWPSPLFRTCPPPRMSHQKQRGYFFLGGGGKYLFLRIPEQHQSGIYNEIRLVLSDLSYIRLLKVNSRLQKERNGMKNILILFFHWILIKSNKSHTIFDQLYTCLSTRHLLTFESQQWYFSPSIIFYR